MKLMYKGRVVKNLEVDDVFTNDYPDFCDAFFSYAEYENGTPLTDDELTELAELHGDVLNELCYDRVCAAAEDAYDRAMDR